MYQTKTSFSLAGQLWARQSWPVSRYTLLLLVSLLTRNSGLDDSTRVDDSILTRGCRDSTDNLTSAFCVCFCVEYLFSLIRLPFD